MAMEMEISATLWAHMAWEGLYYYNYNCFMDFVWEYLGDLVSER